MTTTINASTSAGLVNTADTSGILQLQTANTTAVTIDASQNVGIGTTGTNTVQVIIGNGSASTAPQLYINGGTSGANGPGIYGQGAGSTEWLIASLRSATGGGATGMVDYVYGANPRVFYTNGTERMRIDSSGNVLIGKTSVIAAGSNILQIENGDGAGQIILNNTRSSGNQYMEQFYRLGTLVGSIQTSTIATLYMTSSDYRLKENVAPMTGALDKVAQLKPVTYTWKSNGSEGQGFIAHELAEIIPDCVAGEKDAVNEDGSPKYQGVDTSFLVATLTAAIQEQQTLIVSQSELINNLTARVTALEAK